jgi:DNA-binding transcriptional regulator YiaG
LVGLSYLFKGAGANMIKKYNDQTHKLMTNERYNELIRHKGEKTRLKNTLMAFFPEWHREQRERYNLSRHYFAELMGMSEITVINYENGVRLPMDIINYKRRVETAHLKFLKEQIEKRRGEYDETL